MKIRKFIAAVMMLSVLTAVGCSAKTDTQKADTKTEDTQEGTYRQITAVEAKKIMDEEKDYVILDVRTQEEYDEGHIPGAVLLPLDTIKEKAEEVLPDKDQQILVYCRSGNRSKQASRLLTEMEYTNIVEFGGIMDWPYGTEK